MSNATNPSAIGLPIDRPGWTRRFFRSRLATLPFEMALFVLAFFFLLPSPSSEVHGTWVTPSRSSAALAVGLFFGSRLIARLSGRDGLTGMLFKTTVFAAFAFVLTDILGQMSSSEEIAVHEGLAR